MLNTPVLVHCVTAYLYLHTNSIVNINRKYKSRFTTAANHGIGPNTVSTFHRTVMKIEIPTPSLHWPIQAAAWPKKATMDTRQFIFYPVKFSVRRAPWFPGTKPDISLRSDAWTLFLLAYMFPLGLVWAIFPVFDMVFCVYRNGPSAFSEWGLAWPLLLL
ncbi:uncharacterized protein ASPGLDRAFT_894019 [Aspergillus glaucus CBS 516.65]|uniref:Uncharacterized protein n=1 Tax=Aspergillus glaucus CBS 516.65 TaxID=1160497 RepID=A0A1L9V7T8_ASPGL|nr:hypothetical protein ASPGLDRAFT_894019 [Aspergillus glaucus CBS 516.65]OJJ79986.1 hypothetical protein ASPGLDRAFT_894019 [Aspergillus glaucus CBS 516.65]